jgi:hypothetical protein
MITQQVASYLIKKMETAIKKPNEKAADKTDELFKYYLATKSKKTSADIIVNGTIDNAAIVEAFRWRAAELVSLLSCCVLGSPTHNCRPTEHMRSESLEREIGIVC